VGREFEGEKNIVFKHLLNQSAFVDRIGLSVWTEEKPLVDGLLEVENTGILSRDSLYSRRISGISPLTGNPVRILYGKVSRLPRVPPVSIGFRSEELPLTGSQVNETVRMLFPGAQKVQPVVAELTFDLTEVSVGELHRGLIHRARQWNELEDASGKKTVYVGSAKSAWQIRIYDKAPRIVRFELIVRREFLSQYRILQADSLLGLRIVDVLPLFSLRIVSRDELSVEAARRYASDSFWIDFLCSEIDRRPLQSLCRMLSVTVSDRNRLFPVSPLQAILSRMQRNLVW
jgi:hypothetical protein